MRRKLLVGSMVTLALTGAGAITYMQLVKAGVLKYNKYDRRAPGQLQVGDNAPNLELTMFDGSNTRLAKFWEAKPVFLDFGSCT